MIAIKIKNEYFDLPETFQISMQQQSPLFKESATATGYSYPIEIPLTAKNRQILGYLDKTDIAKDFEPYPCIISFAGAQLVIGTLNLNSIDQNKASAYIIEYDFDSKLLESNIRDIPLGGVRNIVPTLYAEMYEHANALVDSDADSSDYVFFPCYNERFYEGNENMKYTFFPSPHTYSKVVNLWDFQLKSFWLPVTSAQVSLDYPAGGPYGVGSEDPKASTFVPYPYVLAILRYIAAHLGNYTLVGDWVSNAAIKKLTIYNTYALDNIESTFPYYRQNQNINLANHLPDISVADFLEGLAKMFNLSVFIDTKNKRLKIDSKQTLYENATQEQKAYVPDLLIAPSSQYGKNGYTFSMLTDDADTRQDLFKDWEIDDRVLTDADTFDSTDKYEDIRFSPTYYRAKIKGARSNSQLPAAPKLKIKGGAEKIEINCGTVDTAKGQDINYSYFDGFNPSTLVTYTSGIIPFAAQIGNSDVYGVKEEYAFRLLFYAGMHADPNGLGLYPIGTSNVYDDAGNQILPYSLKWRGGQHALYEAWWQKWVTVYAGKKITVPLILSIAEILALDLTKKIRIANRLYLITDISYTLSKNGISIVKANCIQIP